MSFASRLTRHPIPFDPDRGADALAHLPGLSPDLRPLIEGTGGCSPYLAGLIGKESAWLAEALTQDPGQVHRALLLDTAAVPLNDLAPGLRRLKRRVALYAALADLGGVWSLEQVTGLLTDFADAAVDVAIRRLVAAEAQRGKIPGMTEEDAETGAGMVALAMGNDRFAWRRLLGLLIGLAGVLLLAGPQSLPDAAMVLWLPVALIAPFCYALEGNFVARLGTQGMGPGHALFGASVAAMLIALPLALTTGQFIDPRGLDFGAAEFAVMGSSVIHVLVYTGYVWLVGRAGAVFAAQVSYAVTGSGVLWAMVLLGETYSAYVWLALVLILGGVFLVQPRHKRPMVAKAPAGQGGTAAQ